MGVLLTLLIFIAALLYSTVGHGGASGYLAAMALFGIAPDVMKPTALVLNLFVAGADVRTTAGVSAAFILVNSAAGLLGNLVRGHGIQSLPREIAWWAPVAFIGGVIGAELGSRRLTPLIMRRLLAAVLVVAGLKM